MTPEQLDELEAHAEGRLLTGDEAREELVRVIGLLRKARAKLTCLRTAIMGAGISEPVQANLPFLLIDIDSWKRIRAEALSDVPEPSPTTSE